MIAGKPTKWTVFNHTDGIPATSESFDTFMDAKSWIESWRTNLNKQQGFYLTSDLRRIPVDDVAMKIHEVDKLPDTKPILTEPIHDAYGDGVSPDTFSDIIDKLDTTTLHNDIEIMVVCESTGKKYKALADVIRSDDGTLCISGIKHDDEAIAQECMEKFMGMLQFKADVDACGNFAEYWTAQHGLDEYIEEFGVWCALRKYFADYIAEARKFKRRGCKKDCVRATWGEKCEGKCEWPIEVFNNE